MKPLSFLSLAFALLPAFISPALADDSDPKATVAAAAARLGATNNYSWQTTVELGGGGRFRPGPINGKTEKDGFTLVTLAQGDNVAQAVLKDGKGAVKIEGEWESLADAAKDDGSGPNPRIFMVRMLRNLKTPVSEVQNLLTKIKALKNTDGAWTADLTEDGAKSLLIAGRRPGGDGKGPTISGAKGTVKFWITDGVLAKYQFQVQGSVDFGGNGRDIDRTTTIEIKDIGNTNVPVPEDAKKKLS